MRTSGFRLGDDYDNEEEFAAVVVTNVYLSEKKQTALRADHGWGVLQNPDKFLDSPHVPAPVRQDALGQLPLTAVPILRQPRQDRPPNGGF